MSVQDLPERLVRLRAEHGYNRVQLAEKMEIPYRTMVNYENGSREPGHDFIIALAALYNISTDEILLGRKPQNVEKAIKTDTKDQLVAAGFISKSYELTDLDHKFLHSLAAQLKDWFDTG